MEHFFHVPAGKVFQSTAYKHPGKKGLSDRAFPAQKPTHQNSDSYSAPSINRAVGTDEKASVDKTVKLDKLQRYLCYPPQNRKSKEENHKVT